MVIKTAPTLVLLKVPQNKLYKNNPLRRLYITQHSFASHPFSHCGRAPNFLAGLISFPAKNKTFRSLLRCASKGYRVIIKLAQPPCISATSPLPHRFLRGSFVRGPTLPSTYTRLIAHTLSLAAPHPCMYAASIHAEERATPAPNARQGPKERGKIKADLGRREDQWALQADPVRHASGARACPRPVERAELTRFAMELSARARGSSHEGKGPRTLLLL